MLPHKFLHVALTLALFLVALLNRVPADEPKEADDNAVKAAEPGTLIVIDGAGKEHKLKTWKFTAGLRHLSWLAPAAAPEKAPADKEKDAKPAPKARPTPTGPEALVVREDNSTLWANGILTLVPLDRLRAIDFDNETETMKVRVAISAKPEDDLTLTGTTQFKGINQIGIDAEVDKGDLGIAEVRFTGGSPKGIRGVRFSVPKVAAEAKDGRPAAITYGDRSGKHVVNVTDLQGLYKTLDGEMLSGLLFFKKTVKIDVAKLKKLVPHKDEGSATEPVWGVTLKSGGDEETLSLMTRVQIDGKDAQLEGLLGRVPAGFKLFPIHLLQEVEFDVKKDESEVKPKPEK